MARIAPVALIVALLAGCGGPRTPAEGGSHSPKAQENRKLAETYTVAAATGAATAEVALHPDWEKKSLGARFAARVEKMLHGEQSVSVPAAPPTATPTPPAPPPPQPTPTPAPTPEPPPARVELAPRPVPPPSGSVLVRERVACEVPLPTEDEAEEATLQAAADRIHAAFARLDPPLDYRPSPAAVKADFLRRDSRLVRPPTDAEKEALKRAGYASDRVYVEYTLEATAEQVREIRGRERVAGSLKLFGLLAAAAAVGFVFLRVDAWSQGYLTSWLSFIAAALAGGAVVAYVFA